MPMPPSHRPERDPRGAGGPIFLVLIVSTVVGFLLRQPTIGFLIGAALGVAIAGVLWRADRR